jgi:hypothetical protein
MKALLAGKYVHLLKCEWCIASHVIGGRRSTHSPCFRVVCGSWDLRDPKKLCETLAIILFEPKKVDRNNKPRFGGRPFLLLFLLVIRFRLLTGLASMESNEAACDIFKAGTDLGLPGLVRISSSSLRRFPDQNNTTHAKAYQLKRHV